ncbi:MAG: hypothetical protein HZA53_05880 [Planctomycetes bacterium]|nr:hypothetical protein [Planctomycetota bacterium]
MAAKGAAAASCSVTSTKTAAEHALLRDGPRSRLVRALLLFVVMLVPQCVLFGPSLVGAKVLLPLDLLKTRASYLPVDLDAPTYRPQDFVLADLVYELEHERRYAVESIRSGRIPLWIPFNYCGTPFLAANHTSVFYPLRALDYLFPGPVVIAWVQLAKALLAGLGAYLFLRRALQLGFWSSTFAAALWPCTGFLVLWAGFTISQVGAHLPWMLLCADECVKRPRSLWPIALALATGVLLVSGHASIAAHVLLATGLYALFRLWMEHGLGGLARRSALAGLLALAFGVGTGALLSAPQSLPTLEYMRESWRIQKRQEGRVETPPMGATALHGVVMPYYFGSSQRHTTLVVDGNRPEGPQAAYAGMLALLVLAPIGFSATRRRLARFQWFWLFLGFLGLAQVLDVPLLARVFELPGLNTLRNNRFTLVSAWSTVAMAAFGLELLLRGEFAWRRWMWWPLCGSAALALYMLARASEPPALLRMVEDGLKRGLTGARPPVDTLAGLAAVNAWFARVYLGYAGLAALGCGAWFLLRTRFARRSAFALGLGVVALGEVAAQAVDVNVQCDPELYFPRVPVLDDLARRPWGRIAGGLNTFPAVLNQVYGLHDLRGYDAADPARYVEFLQLFAHAKNPPMQDYSALQYYLPDPYSPLARLVGLRYLVACGKPDPNALFAAGGFWIWGAPEPLPRAFVAARAEVVNQKAARLERMKRADFDPAALVLVESETPIVADAAIARGTARILVDEPQHVEHDVDVASSGWLVLADRFAPGWNAEVDGRATPLLCADHTFRAVRVEAGAKRVVFRYAPASWRNGLVLFGVGLALLAAYWAWQRRAPSAVA